MNKTHFVNKCRPVEEQSFLLGSGSLHHTLAFVIDLFGGDNFVDDCLEEVVLSCHPGWKTGDVQLLVANGVIQR